MLATRKDSSSQDSDFHTAIQMSLLRFFGWRQPFRDFKCPLLKTLKNNSAINIDNLD